MSCGCDFPLPQAANYQLWCLAYLSGVRAVTLSLSLRYRASGRAFTARGSRAIAGDFVFTWPL